MAVHNFTLKITHPDAWPPGGPQSNPPLYKFEFGPGSEHHVHKFGHIWLVGLPTPLTIQLKIDSPGFIFRTNATPGDGTSALFISNDPAAKLAFNGFGVFQNPTLDLNNTRLSLNYPAPAGAPAIYYYQLNVIDQNQTPNVAVSLDPIIVNQP